MDINIKTFTSLLSRTILLLLFILFSIGSLLIAFLIRFGLDIPHVYISNGLIIGGLFVLLKFPVYLLTFRYTHNVSTLSHKDILKVVLFSFISSIGIVGINLSYFQLNNFNLFPNSVWLIDFVAFTNLLILFQIIGWSVFNGFIQALKKNTNTSFSFLKSAVYTVKNLIFYERKEENNIHEQLKRLEHI